MSVGTNENVKEIKEEIVKSNKVQEPEIVGIAEKTDNNVVDMEATQRIVLLGEFMQKEAQKFNNEMSAPINDEINETIDNKNIENSNSEQSAEQKAQTNEISNSIKSEEPVLTTPNEVINEQINEINDNQNIKQEEQETADVIKENRTEVNFQLINEVKKDEIKENNENLVEENKKDGNIVEVENKDENTFKVENQDEELEKKKKQHAQDKKDYRLEKMLFDKINTMQGKIKESLELIKKFERINAKEENLPNIVTTLHDKLTHEVIKQFRTVGIEFNMKSFLVQSVVSDLLGRFEEGIREFKDCSENLNFVREVQEDFESRVELAPTSKVKNFFARIRGMFKPERKQEKLEELERDRQEKKLQEANIHLIKYKFINSELEKYTIKNNIADSLSREILHGQNYGVTYSVNDFIDKKVVGEMKKLDLENLVPQLKEKIYKEYKEKDENATIEEVEQMQINVLKKNMKLQKSDLMRSKITQVVNLNNVKVDEEREAI